MLSFGARGAQNLLLNPEQLILVNRFAAGAEKLAFSVKIMYFILDISIY